MATRNVPNYTAVADVDLLIPEIWAQKIYDEHQTQTLMERFIGPEGSASPIIRKTELLSQAGDTIHITRINNLTGSGYSGEGQIRGNEEKLVDASISVVPARFGHAVQWDWPSNKQAIGNMRDLALAGLGYWWRREWDDLAWTAATQTDTGGFDATAIDVIYGGSAGAIDSLDAADVFDTDVILNMLHVLRNNDVAPLMIEGEPLYPMLIHTNQAKDLQDNATWNQAQREANVRGSSNPIFTGALGKYNGALLFATTNCPTGTNANTPAVKYATAVAMGAEALCVGEGSPIMWIEDGDQYEGYFGVTVRQYLKFEILNHKNIVKGITTAVDPA